MKHENEIQLFDEIEAYRSILKEIYGVHISLDQAINVLKLYQYSKISKYLEQVEPELNNIQERISELPGDDLIKDKLTQIVEALTEISLK